MALAGGLGAGAPAPTGSLKGNRPEVRIPSGAWVSESTLTLTDFCFLSPIGHAKEVTWWHGLGDFRFPIISIRIYWHPKMIQPKFTMQIQSTPQQPS